MYSYEKDQERLQRLLQECENDEIPSEPNFDDESDADESDHEETEIFVSESEQDISEPEVDVFPDNSSLFIGNYRKH